MLPNFDPNAAAPTEEEVRAAAQEMALRAG